MHSCAVILLAEDDEDYLFLLKRVFAKAHIPNPIHVVRDGEETIAYLKGEGAYSNRDEYPLPDVLLLDLKMPRINGFDVLKWIRSEPGLSALRILVLTNSDQTRDVNEAYRLGANSFLVKPIDFQDFTRLSRLIADFWFKASRAPETFRPPLDSSLRPDPLEDNPKSGTIQLDKRSPSTQPPGDGEALERSGKSNGR